MFGSRKHLLRAYCTFIFHFYTFLHVFILFSFFSFFIFSMIINLGFDRAKGPQTFESATEVFNFQISNSKFKSFGASGATKLEF